jgi:hypothetical protein
MRAHCKDRTLDTVTVAGMETEASKTALPLFRGRAAFHWQRWLISEI